MAANAEPVTPFTASKAPLTPEIDTLLNPLNDVAIEPNPPDKFVPKLAAKLPNDIACDTALPMPATAFLAAPIAPVT